MSRKLSSSFLLVAFALFSSGRAEKGPEETLPQGKYEEFRAKFPMVLLGYDDEDCPVWLTEFGKWDFRSVLDKGQEEVKSLDIYMNNMFYNFARSGDNATGAVMIADFEGYTLEKATHLPSLSFLLGLFRKVGKYFVDGSLKSAIAINSNFIFQQIYTLGKPVLGAFGERIELHGTNPDKWKPLVLRIISGDKLPPFLGGTKEDFKPLKIVG